MSLGLSLTWAHDVSPGENKLDGALVHPLGGQQERELVEETQGGDPGLVVMSAKCVSCKQVDKQVV